MSIYKNDSPADLDIALDSLLQQSCQADEIVLVSDGPVGPGIQSVVSKYLNLLPINYVELSVNVGLGNALNEGMRHTTNDWIFRMDSDDICVNDRFKIQLEFIEKNKEVGLFGGYISEFSQPGCFNQDRVVPLNNSDIRYQMRNYSPFNHVTVCFDKNKVLNVGGYEGGQNFQEDYFLWLKLAKTDIVFGNIPHVLVHVRTGDAMIGRRGGWEYYKNEIKVSYFGYKNGLFPFIYFIRNAIVKLFIRLAPPVIRKYIYSIVRYSLSKLIRRS